MVPSSTASSYVRLQRIVYETICEPPPGYKVGEIVTTSVMILIAINVILSILETEKKVYDTWPDFFHYFELISVMIFTAEYVLTMWSCTAVNEQNNGCLGRIKAMLRPMAIVDVLAIAPFYLNKLFRSNDNIDLRFLRTLRLVRLISLFRSGHISDAFQTLIEVVQSKRRQLGLGMSNYFFPVLLCSSFQYIIESSHEGTKFTSIPASLWWGIVTMTTIGYGDMVPETALGKVFASFVVYLGVCLIALPVGIIASGFTNHTDNQVSSKQTKAVEKTIAPSSPHGSPAEDHNSDIFALLMQSHEQEEMLEIYQMALPTIKEAIRHAEENGFLTSGSEKDVKTGMVENDILDH